MSDNILKLPPRPNFDLNSRGAPLATIENLERLLKAHGITISYNRIYKDIDIHLPGKELNIENKFDCASAELVSLATEYKMPAGNIDRYLVAIAQKNRINPVATWIESIAWDGQPRLEEFYATIESEDEELKKLFMRKWCISAIAAAYIEEGVSAHGVLVFQGDQYIGKTQWFKRLVDEEFKDFVKDGLHIDLKNKDTLIACFSRWLVELGEIPSTFRKSENDALKAFITADRDLLRVPYGKAFSEFPRSTVFFGSVNDRKYLSDPTGNRRFWTVACKRIHHDHSLNMQQVWAEFKVLYDNKESWFLTHEELAQLNLSNEEHELVDPIYEKLVESYEWGRDHVSEKTATKILEEIGIKNIGRGETTKCGMFLRKLGSLARRSNGVSLNSMPPTRTP